MPELPEVETIRRGLSKRLIGHKITAIEVESPKSFQGKKEAVIGSTIEDIERRAKVIRIKLGGGQNLLFHLKMTGQLIYLYSKTRFAGGHPSHDWHAELPNKYSRITFHFDNDSVLYFNDLRKFGFSVTFWPSVDVITGLIKANIATRIAFAVASQADSRTILDMGGAEKLLGNGDMLFTSAEISKPRRIQGAFVSEKEVREITDFIKAQSKPEYNEEILLQNSRGAGGIGFGAPDDDLFMEAAECVIRSGKASASLLQRRLRIGYARAARLLDLLEEHGVVGPADGARPRDVMVEDINDVLAETDYREE